MQVGEGDVMRAGDSSQGHLAQFWEDCVRSTGLGADARGEHSSQTSSVGGRSREEAAMSPIASASSNSSSPTFLGCRRGLVPGVCPGPSRLP